MKKSVYINKNMVAKIGEYSMHLIGFDTRTETKTFDIVFNMEHLIESRNISKWHLPLNENTAQYMSSWLKDIELEMSEKLDEIDERIADYKADRDALLNYYACIR